MKGIPFLAAVFATLVSVNMSAGEKQLVGWVERASINPGNLSMNAKVDTGADNSSIDARNIVASVRGGKKILRFEVDNREGKTVTFEREQVGIEIVPRHHGEFEERPLVILEICLGTECRNTLVNLADRRRLKYPLLIGRSFMLDRVVVNPSEEYITKTGQ